MALTLAHEPLQRDALFTLGAGGLAGALMALSAGLAEVGWLDVIAYRSPTEVRHLTGALTVGAAALLTLVRAFPRGRPWRWRRMGVLLVGLALTGALALRAADLLGPTVWLMPGGSSVSAWAVLAVGGALTGGLTGSVLALCYLTKHLSQTRTDTIASVWSVARETITGEERSLCERAVIAAGRLVDDLHLQQRQDARELAGTTVVMAHEVIDLSRRSQALRRELEGIDRKLHADRIAELEAAAATATDSAACADFQRAAAAASSFGRHVAALEGAAERVRARLHLEVLALESAALALATRRASTVADAALALAPLHEELQRASDQLRAEAAALDELGTQPMAPISVRQPDAVAKPLAPA